MRRLLCIAWLGVLVVAANAQPKGSDRELAELKGTAKTVKSEIALIAINNGISSASKRAITEIASYDIDGRLIEKVTHERSYGVTHAYTYDAAGNRIESAVDRDELIRRSWIFKHDDAGRRILEVASDGGGVVYRGEYAYDNAGRLRESRILEGRGVMPKRWLYAYDNEGHIVERSLYRDKDLPSGKEFYTYEFDATGNWVKRVTLKSKTGKSQTPPVPVSVTYRTITYY